MVIGRTLQKALEKFFKSPVVQDARCQVLLPSGEFLDLTGVKLLEKDRKNVRTFASYEQDDELFSDRNVFPIGCIIKMEKVTL